MAAQGIFLLLLLAGRSLGQKREGRDRVILEARLQPVSAAHKSAIAKYSRRHCAP